MWLQGRGCQGEPEWSAMARFCVGLAFPIRPPYPSLEHLSASDLPLGRAFLRQHGRAVGEP